MAERDIYSSWDYYGKTLILVALRATGVHIVEVYATTISLELSRTISTVRSDPGISRARYWPGVCPGSATSLIYTTAVSSSLRAGPTAVSRRCSTWRAVVRVRVTVSASGRRVRPASRSR
jgi:hypothetical protein